MNKDFISNYKLQSSFLLGLRLMSGWLFVSAFIRRVISVPEKLDPSSLEYVGIKFNTFLPHAVGIQWLLDYLLTHPELLFGFLVLFTCIEGLCGLGMMLGLFTRLTALGGACLSFGILLGAGWMGSTCLDEWQIGVSGVACGLALLVMGSGYYSLDNLFFEDKLYDNNHKPLVWFTSGKLPLADSTLRSVAVWVGIITLGVTLWSYQVMHGGLWGHLHNDSVEPDVEISNVVADAAKNQLDFEVFRISGPDTYGAFIIEMEIVDAQGKPVWKYDFAKNGLEGKKSTGFTIKNFYISRVEVAKYSLEIPLGAKATITTHDAELATLKPGRYILKLMDISGKSWEKEMVLR